MNYYLEVLKKYTEFTGRASRREYWMFVLFNILIIMVLSILESVLGLDKMGSSKDNGLLTSLYQLAVALPSIAVAIRRMHDINKSGWFILIPLYNIILACQTGDAGANKYGPSTSDNQTKPQKPTDPKATDTPNIPVFK